MEQKLSNLELSRRSDTYPLAKDSKLALKLLVLVPLLGYFFLGISAYQSYRSIAPMLFKETGFAAEYVTVTLIGTMAGNILAPLIGKLGDLFGRRIMLLVTAILPVIGALLMGAGSSLALLAIGYSVCMMTNSFRSPLVNGLIADLFTREERPKMLSIQQSFNLLPQVFAPMLGSVVAAKIGTQPWYLISAAIFALAFIIALIGIPKVEQTEKRNKNAKIDWIGTVLMQLPVITTCVAIGMGGKYFGWTSPIAIALYAVSVVGFIAFGKYETSGKAVDPFLDFSIFKIRNYVLVLILTALTGALASITQRFLTLYLLDGLNFSTKQVSVGFLFCWVGVVLSPLIGTFVAKTGRYRLIVGLSCLFNCIMAGIVYIFFCKLGICTIALYIIVMLCDSIMAALQVGPMSAMITNSISHDKVGIALSTRVFAATVFTSVFGAVYNAIYNAAGDSIVTSFSTMCLLTLIIGVVRLVIALFIDDKAIAGSKL